MLDPAGAQEALPIEVRVEAFEGSAQLLRKLSDACLLVVILSELQFALDVLGDLLEMFLSHLFVAPFRFLNSA